MRRGHTHSVILRRQALPGVIAALARCRDGAVTPTLALSITALIAIGGLAFDYARLAGLDTELQNAADHAALAAASQLDGRPGACQRAASAARTMVQNHSLFANDGEGSPITLASEAGCDAVGSVRFYQDQTKATPATADGNARFVEVSVSARRTNYALTPVIGVLASGAMTGTAFAGLSSAVCKVPPLMMCNPHENPAGGGSVDVAALVGKGILAKAGGSSMWAPGNFGFLDIGAGPGANSLREAFGKVETSFQCIRAGHVDTAPGNMDSITAAINTRFDIYENGWAAQCGGEDCPPAFNTVKDLVRRSNGGCGLNPNNRQGWHPVEAPQHYRPDPVTRTDTSVTVIGHPRDICHAVSLEGDCSGGRIGDGAWDRDIYFRVNHGLATRQAWQSRLQSEGVANFASPTRYEVYLWELKTGRLAPRAVGNALSTYSAPICGTPVGPPAHADRRVTSIAVVNCIEQAVTGRATNVKVEEWLDIFLVEPSYQRWDDASLSRTMGDEVYVEVIGRTRPAGGRSGPQTVRRDVPYLIE